MAHQTDPHRPMERPQPIEIALRSRLFEMMRLGFRWPLCYLTLLSSSTMISGFLTTKYLRITFSNSRMLPGQ